jgi:hypothetical protein
VHLALPRLVLREHLKVFRDLLRRGPARAQLLRFSVSAVRRSAALPVEDVVKVKLHGAVGAAQQQLGDGCGMAFARGQVQRRVPARQTAAGTRPPHTLPIRRKRKRRTRRSLRRSRRRRMRRATGRFGDCRSTPPSAARSSDRYCCARRGRGEVGGPHGGTSVP